MTKTEMINLYSWLSFKNKEWIKKTKMSTFFNSLIDKIERLIIRINVRIDINILNFNSADDKARGKKGKRK